MDKGTEFEGSNEVYEEIYKAIDEQLKKAFESNKKSSIPMLASPMVPEDLRTSTFYLPAVNENLRKFFRVDKVSEKRLGERLNWTPRAGPPPTQRRMRLYTLLNDGNNDCVFHAVSIALWGCNDRHQILRRVTNAVMVSHEDELRPIWLRGMKEMVAKGLLPELDNEEEIERNWKHVHQSTKEPGVCAQWFIPFVLSNILGRPIVMHGKEIFLPSMMHPEYCYKTPIVVGCTRWSKFFHLSSLVGVEGELSHVLLVDENGERLPVWFRVEDGREGTPCPKTVPLDRYMELTWFKASDGKKYPLVRMGVMKLNPGNDAVIQTAKRVTSLFEKKKEEEQRAAAKTTKGSKAGGSTATYVETAEHAGSAVGAADVRPEEAKRKREVDGPDEGELSRPSKKTSPSSPYISVDPAVDHGPDSALSIAPASPVVELSRRSKRTLPSSPSMSVDAAVDHGADSALPIAPASPLAATYVETAEQAGSVVCADDVRPEEAKRKREVDGPDEGELSRPSKKTSPSSPYISVDPAVDHGPDSALSIAPASPVVELSRRSKRTLPSSPSMSVDAAVDHGADSALPIAPASPLAATYVETAAQAGSAVCADDVRPEEAKRKREVDGPDEVELSRLSKRTLPSSPSISFDTPVDHALSIAPASPLAVHVLPMPSPSARSPPMERPFAGEPGIPDAGPLRGRGRLATACLAAAATAGVATTILIVRAKW